jgi:hypothetical protein
MRFAAVAIAIRFTSGIALGLWPVAANRAPLNWLRRFSQLRCEHVHFHRDV